MAKVGTAHVEIKPVLNQGALDALVQRIEDAVAAGVERALGKSRQNIPTVISIEAEGLSAAYDRTRNCPCRTENGGSGVCGCVLGGYRVTS